MRVLLTDSCYIEFKPIKWSGEVYINDNSIDMFLGFAYLGLIVFTVYLKLR